MYTKFVSLLLFTLIAFSKTQADECSDERKRERVGDCIEDLLTFDSDSAPVEEVCRKVDRSQRCLRAVVDECLSKEERDEFEIQFEAIALGLAQGCPNLEDSEREVEDEDETNDANDCLDKNKDYILGCLIESQERALQHFLSQSNPDQNDVLCTVYNWITECVIVRTQEKCGIEVSDTVREGLNAPPEEIKDACRNSNTIWRF